jgi:hypothetical protein
MIISGILALAITILFIKVVNLQEEVKNLKTTSEKTNKKVDELHKVKFY